MTIHFSHTDGFFLDACILPLLQIVWNLSQTIGDCLVCCTVPIEPYNWINLSNAKTGSLCAWKADRYWPCKTLHQSPQIRL